MRILLDTNVLIAAFVSRGACYALLDHCAEAHHLVTSEGLLEEYREKLVRKFHLPAAEIRVNVLRSFSHLVTPDPLSVPTCRDPDDDLVLATAVAGKCACIVTGDQDLLVLGEYAGIAIIPPGGFANFENTASARD